MKVTSALVVWFGAMAFAVAEPDAEFKFTLIPAQEGEVLFSDAWTSSHEDLAAIAAMITTLETKYGAIKTSGGNSVVFLETSPLRKSDKPYGNRVIKTYRRSWPLLDAPGPGYRAMRSFPYITPASFWQQTPVR